MKRFIALTLMFLMLLIFCSCNDIAPVPQNGGENKHAGDAVADKLLLEKRNSIVSEVQLFPEGRVHEATYDYHEMTSYEDYTPYESVWLKNEGVLAACLYDLDADGVNELYVLKLENEADSVQLVSEVFYVKNNKVISAGNIKVNGGGIYGEMLYNVKAFLAEIDGALRICLESTTTYMYDADRGPLTIAVYEYKDNCFTEYISIKGSEGVAPVYSITTPENSFELDCMEIRANEYPLLDTVNEIGFPEPDYENMSPQEDHGIGGYAENCSYYDHRDSIKLCRITTSYLHHNQVMGSSSYIVYEFVDNTDTHKDLAKEEAVWDDGPQVIPQAYDEILTLYIDGFEYWHTANIPGLENESYLYAYCDDLSEVGFVLYDIDNNGTDELLMIKTDEYSKQTLLDMYTLKDNKAVHLAAAGERYIYSVNQVDDGLICQRWSNSAFSNGESWYRINEAGDGLDTIISIFYDYAPGSDTETCLYVSYKADLSSKQVISEEDYDAFAPEYYEEYFQCVVTLQEYITK